MKEMNLPAAMTISNDAKLVTFINVFTVEPANQQRLVDPLAHATVESEELIERVDAEVGATPSLF